MRPVLWPAVQRVGGTVHTHEAFAAVDKRHDRGLLVCSKRQLAAGEREEEDVVVGEVPCAH